jgi:hypothetical protein
VTGACGVSITVLTEVMPLLVDWVVVPLLLLPLEFLSVPLTW